jgi:cell wall assembly regulator SMI1
MNAWQEFRKTVEEKYPRMVGVLASGTQRERIDELAAKVGVSFPDSFFDIYQDADGAADDLRPFFFGMELLSLEEIGHAMEREFELIENLKGEGDMCSSFPENHINCEYANAKWVPLFHGGGGSYIGLDFDPADEGQAGQIINFGIDEEDKCVLSPTLEDFLRLCANKLDSATKIHFDEELGMFIYSSTFFPDALRQEIQHQVEASDS